MSGGVVSRGDRAMLLGLLLILAIAASLTPIRNYDYWWHLATGRLILDQGAVPRADPFSFTASGTPWIDHEWLFQVIACVLHRHLGPAALVLLKVAAVLGIGLLASDRLRREGHGPAGMAVILLPAILGASFRLDVRPELATLVLIPAAIEAVLRARQSGRAWPLLLPPALAVLGSNLHVGIILLPAILLLGSGVCLALAGRVGDAAGARGDRAADRRFAGRLALSAVATALAVGINPFGFALYEVPLRLSALLGGLPSPNLEWARPDLRNFPLFFAAAVVFLVVVVAGRRRIDPVATPAALLALVLAAAHLRNVGLFCLLLPWGAAGPARAVVNALQRLPVYRTGTADGTVRPGFITAAVLLLTGVPMLLWLPPWPVVWGAGVAADNQPSAAVDFMESNRLGERLFNDVRFGGYLVWRRFPERRVFIDGRNEIYPDLLREIFAALREAPAWEALLDRHGIDAAFLRYPPTLQKIELPASGGRPGPRGERAFSAVYFPRERWALLYWDDDAMIFVRRNEKYRDVIGRLEYTAINPDDWAHTYAGIALGRIPPGPAVREIRRKLAEDPSCARARFLLDRFGPLEEALRGGPAISPDAAHPGVNPG